MTTWRNKIGNFKIKKKKRLFNKIIPVVKSMPANAGNVGSIPPGRPHMPRGN